MRCPCLVALMRRVCLVALMRPLPCCTCAPPMRCTPVTQYHAVCSHPQPELNRPRHKLVSTFVSQIDMVLVWGRCSRHLSVVLMAVSLGRRRRYPQVHQQTGPNGEGSPPRTWRQNLLLGQGECGHKYHHNHYRAILVVSAQPVFLASGRCQTFGAALLSAVATFCGPIRKVGAFPQIFESTTTTR